MPFSEVSGEDYCWFLDVCLIRYLLLSCGSEANRPLSQGDWAPQSVACLLCLGVVSRLRTLSLFLSCGICKYKSCWQLEAGSLEVSAGQQQQKLGGGGRCYTSSFLGDMGELKRSRGITQIWHSPAPVSGEYFSSPLDVC